MTTIFVSILLSITISVLITTIGIVCYMFKINEIYNNFMEEYADEIRDVTIEAMKEWMQTRRK